jgi:hypothetical protein
MQKVLQMELLNTTLDYQKENYRYFKKKKKAQEELILAQLREGESTNTSECQ